MEKSLRPVTNLHHTQRPNSVAESILPDVPPRKKIVCLAGEGVTLTLRDKLINVLNMETGPGAVQGRTEST